MAGLSIVLEAQKGGVSMKAPQVINKVTMIISKPAPPPSTPSSSRTNSQPLFLSPTFLDHCFLCQQKLLPGKDIYMYKGDKAFCSVECRCRQIFMDEEESVRTDNCALAPRKPTLSSSSSSSSSATRHRKGTRNRAGGFAD